MSPGSPNVPSLKRSYLSQVTNFAPSFFLFYYIYILFLFHNGAQGSLQWFASWSPNQALTQARPA